MEKKMETALVQNQMEKKMENEGEATISGFKFKRNET